MPGKTLIEELLHLMAAHYVCGVEYLNVQTLLYFFQDILMERLDRHGPATRYNNNNNNNNNFYFSDMSIQLPADTTAYKSLIL